MDEDKIIIRRRKEPKTKSINKPIQLGLCCLNITLKENKPSIYPSRTITKAILKREGFEELQNRAIKNLEDLIQMIKWNEKNGIKVFRISSSLFPRMSEEREDEEEFSFREN